MSLDGFLTTIGAPPFTIEPDAHAWLSTVLEPVPEGDWYAFIGSEARATYSAAGRLRIEARSSHGEDGPESSIDLRNGLMGVEVVRSYANERAYAAFLAGSVPTWRYVGPELPDVARTRAWLGISTEAPRVHTPREELRIRRLERPETLRRIEERDARIYDTYLALANNGATLKEFDAPDGTNP